MQGAGSDAWEQHRQEHISRRALLYTLFWQCNLCDEVGEGRAAEQQHISQHPEEQCLCGQRMTSAHLSYGHIHVDYCCSMCKVQLKTQMAMDLHLQVMHTN